MKINKQLFDYQHFTNNIYSKKKYLLFIRYFSKKVTEFVKVYFYLNFFCVKK